MARAVLADVSAPYSAFETFVYDRVIAPAVLAMGERIAEELAAEISETARMLDVGSGGGQLALEIAGRRPEARDRPRSLWRTRWHAMRPARRGSAARRSVRFVQGSALQQPFDDASFDVVTSVASIKHWPDQARGLAECVRVPLPVAASSCSSGPRLPPGRRPRLRGARRLPDRCGARAGAFRTWVAGQAIDLDRCAGAIVAHPLEAQSRCAGPRYAGAGAGRVEAAR
jgi:SAM-dependent methyltransferase